MSKQRALSIGAVVLAFLTSQHHTLHMLVLVFGLGSAGASFMRTAPWLRRGMLLMSLVMPYDKLSVIVSNSQLVGSNEVPIFLKAINQACFILGVLTLLAIIPSLLRSPGERKIAEIPKS